MSTGFYYWKQYTTEQYREQTKTQTPKTPGCCHTVELYRDVPGTETHEPGLHPPSSQQPNMLTIPAKPTQLHARNSALQGLTGANLRVFLVLWLCTWKYKILKQDSWFKNITSLLPILREKKSRGEGLAIAKLIFSKHDTVSTNPSTSHHELFSFF